MTINSQHKSMGFKSIIPADRITLDGNVSRASAIVYWSINDVYEYERRKSVVHSVEYKKSVKTESMAIERTGVGIVPLKIEIQSTEKKVIVIF